MSEQEQLNKEAEAVIEKFKKTLNHDGFTIALSCAIIYQQGQVELLERLKQIHGSLDYYIVKELTRAKALLETLKGML